MLINLCFDYYTDVINVPERIGKKIKYYQNKCDKWLFDKSNNHQFWELDDNGNKEGVGICSDAFVFWLNEFPLKDTGLKAEVVQRDLQKYDETLTTLYC